MQERPDAGRHEAIAYQLSVEFDGVLPRATVEAEVEEAEAELRGQVPPGSLDEMLHCLARYRCESVLVRTCRPRSVPQRAGSAEQRGGLDMEARLLLVEDDERIRQALGLALADEGCEVMEAASGEEALGLLGTTAVDVVLLDLMLPGVDGLDVCRTLRAQGDLPIIIVSARTDSADVIEGLEAGADDYVTKPLVASELAARIRALLRRRHFAGETRRSLLIGDVEVFPEEDVVRRAGTVVHLTRTEFRLLVELAAADGRVVTREELLKRVWGYDYFGDTRLLDVHIRRLRRKIERDPDDPECVLTVRGRGYKAGSVG